MDTTTAAAGRSVPEPCRQTLRGDAYRLLAACFYPPAEGIFNSQLFDGLNRTLAEACPEAVPGAQAMAVGATEWTADQLAVEHARLFVGPFELEAPPYGSVYLDGDGRVMGGSTLAVRDLYASEGLVLDAQFGEMPDHIAAELEFLHYLIAASGVALEGGNRHEALRLVQVQRRFLGTFVAPWASLMCDRIRESAASAVYRGLADCVSAYVPSDLEYLDRHLLPELKGRDERPAGGSM